MKRSTKYLLASFLAAVICVPFACNMALMAPFSYTPEPLQTSRSPDGRFQLVTTYRIPLLETNWVDPSCVFCVVVTATDGNREVARQCFDYSEYGDVASHEVMWAPDGRSVLVSGMNDWGGQPGSIRTELPQ